MAISTIGNYLMKKGTDDTYTKLVDIKSIPELFGEQEKLETTTMTNHQHTYIDGLLGSGEDLQCTCNYTVEDFATLKGLEGQTLDLALWFGDKVNAGVYTPDGHNGKFEIKGTIRVSISAQEVNAVAEMILHITPSSEIVFVNPNAGN